MFTGQNPLRYPTKWALNPSAYDNISADQVDWAALAQQWIQMKETCPPEMVPPAPPPPNITPVVRPPAVIKEDFPQVPPAPSWNSATWGFPTPQWPAAPVNNWGWTNPVVATPPPPPPITPVEPVVKEVVQPLLPTPAFNTFPTQSAPSYQTTQPTKGYWTVPEHTVIKDKSAHKEHHDDFNQGFMDSGITLDAAKRKQLPAWIRQGLEKMEREKQKQMEREQDLEQRKLMMEQKRLAEEEALKELQQEGSVGVVKKSKFESDSENEDLNGKAMSEDEAEDVRKPVKPKSVPKEAKPEIIAPFRTKEERLQDLMMCVRQTLTEILLEVTNDEILAISRDTVNRYKNSAQTLRKTNALTSITGGLGLGIYGESSGSESEKSDDENSVDDPRDHRDSDVELERVIRQRRLDFEKTSQEIESRLLEEEEALKRRKGFAPPKDFQNSQHAETSSVRDGEKYNKITDAGPKSSKSALANTHQSSSNRNKAEIPKVEQNHNENKRNVSKKKSKNRKSRSSPSESDSDTDSETDSDSNSSKTESTESSVESKPSSHEKKTNLCRKKSQKSASPDYESKKKRSDKTEKVKTSKNEKNDQFDIVSKEKSVRDGKLLNAKKSESVKEMKRSSARDRSVSPSSSYRKQRSRSREAKRRSRSRYRSRSRDSRRRSRSREDRDRSLSKERRRRSRSTGRRRRSRSRESRYRSRSRSVSRDRRRRSRSRKYEKSHNSDRRNSSRDRRHRSRSNTSRRTRSRSRGKKSHRH